MKNVSMKHLPNSISFLRIIAAIALLFLVTNQTAFIACYFLCGISDLLDGYIARRFRLESRLGEQLDTLGDTVFCFVILYLLFVHTAIMKESWFLLAVGIVLIIRVVNLVITRWKFQTWGILHTLGNKAAGISLYLYVPILVMRTASSLLPGIILFLIACASAIEETAILLTSKKYDANRKSVFIVAKEQF